MATRKNICEDTTLFPKVLHRSRRQNNQVTLRHLLEEAFEGNQLTHEFWGEVEKENGEPSTGWEAEWIQRA